MSFKNKFRITLVCTVLSVSTQALAANEGVSFYYGGGLGFAKIQDSGFDEGLIANASVGFEEKGWAIEYSAFTSTDITNTVDFSFQTTLSGSITSLSYRTVEKKGKYYKIKYGQMDMDFRYSDNSPKDKTDGNMYGVAMGWRIKKDERLELEFDAYDSNDFSNKTYMLSMNYLFGGSSQDADNVYSKTGKRPFYFGVFAGGYNDDLDGTDDPLTYGLMVGLDFSVFGAENLAAEFIYSAADKSEWKDPADPDSYFKDTTSALYAVYKIPVGKTLYTKARLGYAYVSTKDYDGLAFTTDYYSESGLSYGVAIGYELGGGSKIEVGYTLMDLDYNGLKLKPSTITVGYIF
ncbi:MAG TPA: outer membrane beta-barrel protein [Gammaproteobacteria bacterium]